MAEKVADLYAALGVKIDQAAFSRANAVIGKLKGAVVAFLGFKAVQGVFGMFDDVIETGSKFADAAQKTGVAATTLQEYSFAAGLASVSTESLITALGRANKGLAELQETGGGQAAEGLRSLGISVNEVRKGLKTGSVNLDSLLIQVADKFKALPDGPKKVAAAMKLFGKSGADLIPFLNQGGAGIAALKREANELGVVIDEKTVGAVDQLGDDIDRVKAGWQGMKNQAVAAIVPLLAELMPSLIAVMKEMVAWIKEHKTEIAAAFFAAGKVIKTIVQVLVGLGRVLVEIVKMIIWVVQNIIKGFVAIGKWIGRTAAKIVLAFRSAFEWIVGKARWLWNGLVSIGNRIIDVFVSVGTAIKNAFQAALDFVLRMVRAVVNKITDAWNLLRDLREAFDETTGGDAFNEARTSALKAGLPFNMNRREWEEQRDANRAKMIQQGPSKSVPAVPAQGVVAPTSVNVQMPITVNPSPGMNEVDLGNKVGKSVEDRITRMYRQVDKAFGRLMEE